MFWIRCRQGERARARRRCCRAGYRWRGPSSRQAVRGGKRTKTLCARKASQLWWPGYRFRAGRKRAWLALLAQHDTVHRISEIWVIESFGGRLLQYRLRDQHRWYGCEPVVSQDLLVVQVRIDHRECRPLPFFFWDAEHGPGNPSPGPSRAMPSYWSISRDRPSASRPPSRMRESE